MLEEKAWKGGESFYRAGDKWLTCGGADWCSLQPVWKIVFGSAGDPPVPSGDSPGICLA